MTNLTNLSFSSVMARHTVHKTTIFLLVTLPNVRRRQKFFSLADSAIILS